jgi:RNA polymerase sigma-70 factor (ECF subfamily)
MQAHDREELEAQIRRTLEQGDAKGAITFALRGYGPEIFGLLVTLHRSEEDASEVFSLFAEQLWSSVPHFAWQCSFRTWAYAVARKTSLRYRRDAQRREKRNVPLEVGSEASELAAKIRTETRSFLRTEPKNRIAELRDALPTEDQEILMLRVNKQLGWSEIARVMHEGDEPLSEEGIKRESARLRKRFQAIKERLFELGRKEGLIDPERGTTKGR